MVRLRNGFGAEFVPTASARNSVTVQVPFDVFLLRVMRMLRLVRPPDKLATFQKFIVYVVRYIFDCKRIGGPLRRSWLAGHQRGAHYAFGAMAAESC